MTGQELYEQCGNASELPWAAWHLIDERSRQWYDDLAARLKPSITDVREAAVALSRDEQQALYKFLHDACGCRL